jgi:hypothetical protein
MKKYFISNIGSTDANANASMGTGNDEISYDILNIIVGLLIIALIGLFCYNYDILNNLNNFYSCVIFIIILIILYKILF